MSKITRNIGVTGGVLEDFLELDLDDVFIPEGRFRPLDPKSVKVIAESILKNGQLQPILVDKNGNLIDGNHRYHACKELGISVIAKVVDEVNEDKLALMEIDTNLCRKELTQSELEVHLAERKKIYLRLYPDTAKSSFKKADEKTFTEDTADTLGVSKKTVERIVKRGEEATAEMREARDNKELTTSELDEVIKNTSGLSIEDKNEALKAKLKAKAELKNNPKEVAVVAIEPQGVWKEPKGVLPEPADYLVLQAEIEGLKLLLAKEQEANKKLRARIKMAKDTHPEIKI